MAQYIPKDAVLAEIEKRKNLCEKIALDLRTQENKDYYQGKAEAYSEMAELVNTLKVKGVDLQSEIDRVWDNTSDKFLEDGWKEFEDIAKHFFELGLHYSITKECVNEICQLFMEREAIEKFFPDSIDWVYKQLQKGK